MAKACARGARGARGAGPPGEVSGCLALVPEAACRPEVTAGLGTCAWLFVERLSLGGLLQEASLERRFPLEWAGLRAAWGRPWLPCPVPEATCGQELTALVQGLEAWFCAERLSLGGLL